MSHSNFRSAITGFNKYVSLNKEMALAHLFKQFFVVAELPVSAVLSFINSQPCSVIDFQRIGPLGRFVLVVAMSVCMFVCVYVCMSPSHAIFLKC